MTRKHAVIETIINTFIGFVISLLVAPINYWLFDVQVSTSQNIGLTLFMTIISLLRGYFIRRYCSQYLDSLLNTFKTN
jgi:uncharacterized membrane protein